MWVVEDPRRQFLGRFLLPKSFEKFFKDKIFTVKIFCFFFIMEKEKGA